MIGHKRELFLLDDLSYLNCASMSPMLTSVKEAGLRALDSSSAPWKLTSEDWFTNAEILRNLAARIYQTSNNNIAIVPSASYGLAVAAKNLKPGAGKSIVILEDQFPSNYYVWENLATQQNLRLISVQKSTDKNLTESILEKINKDTGIVAIPNCHWIDGAWIDLKKISNAVADSGAYLVLDLSQSLGVLPVDMELIRPDFAVAVGYKWLLGPYSLGYLYVSERWQQAGEPLEYSWMTRKGSEDFTTLINYTRDYRAGARKFDMGEFSQFNSVPMAIVALEQILAWGVGMIQQEIRKLTDPVKRYKETIGLSQDNTIGVGHIVNISQQNIDLEKLKRRLQDNKVVVSFRGKSIRVSPYLYNNSHDIDKLLHCLST